MIQEPRPTLSPASGPPLAPAPGPEASTAEVLDWVVRAHPRAVLVSALGPQSIAVMELLHQAGHRLDVAFLDTGLHFAETLALRVRLQRRYGISIQAVAPEQSVDAQAADHGPALWARQPDRCCALRKVQPLARLLRGRSAWVTGLRRDGSPTRASVQTVEWDGQHGLWKVNPLAAWSRQEVLDFIDEHGVPVNPLLSQGYRSVGCAPCTRPTAPGEDERAGRWQGQAKTECGIHHLYERGEVVR